MSPLEQEKQLICNTESTLHYWRTQENTLNALVRGIDEDQELAIKDLYALLLHMTSTHAPQEFSAIPWSTRVYMKHDIIPDGAASAKMIEIIQTTMLVIITLGSICLEWALLCYL